MARAVHAALVGDAVVFAFDPDPQTPPVRALHLLTRGGRLPSAEVEGQERCLEAAVRAAREAGVDLEGARRSRGPRLGPELVGVDDEPGRGPRVLRLWYMAAVPFGDVRGPGRWAVVGRSLRLDAAGQAALRVALERLRAETRSVAGAAALLGEVFTGDDLLRVNVALHGGLEGSERTFRRRVQELRDSGVLRPVPEREVAALRLRVPRFRSPAGTGGRPPELLRYSGSGGEDMQLAALRARRTA